MIARKLAALLLLPVLLFLVVAPAYADEGPAPNAGFTLERAVVGAGGPHAASASFELDATAGQPAAGPAASADTELVAGFWGALPSGYHVYLPLMLR